MNKQNTVISKIAAVSKAIGGVPASGTNTHFRYQFQPWEEVRRAVRDACLVEGLWVTESMTDCRVESNKTVVCIEITYHADGESLSTLWYGEANDTQDKGVQKAATSAVKYAWLKTFMLTDQDPDPDAGADVPVVKKPAPNPVDEATARLLEWCGGDKSVTGARWRSLGKNNAERTERVRKANSLADLDAELK